MYKVQAVRRRGFLLSRCVRGPAKPPARTWFCQLPALPTGKLPCPARGRGPVRRRPPKSRPRRVESGSAAASAHYDGWRMADGGWRKGRFTSREPRITLLIEGWETHVGRKKTGGHDGRGSVRAAHRAGDVHAL